MGMAQLAATRATCLRKKVGAVIVFNRSVVATGYNGSIRGLEHCSDPGVGCMMEDNHCVRTVHAESNAIAQAAARGSRVQGSSIYVTASPCWSCFRLIANAGIMHVYFGEFYRDDRIFEAATKAGISLKHVTGNP